MDQADAPRSTGVDMAKELEKELAEEAGQGVGSLGWRVQAAGICRLRWMKSKFDLPLRLGVFVEAPQEELEANQEKDVEANEAKMEIKTNEGQEVQLADSPSELQQNPFKSGWV